MDAYIRERSFNLKKCVVSCLFSSEVTLRVERPQAGVCRGRAGGVGVPFGAVSSGPVLRPSPPGASGRHRESGFIGLVSDQGTRPSTFEASSAASSKGKFTSTQDISFASGRI